MLRNLPVCVAPAGGIAPGGGVSPEIGTDGNAASTLTSVEDVWTCVMLAVHSFRNRMSREERYEKTCTSP